MNEEQTYEVQIDVNANGGDAFYHVDHRAMTLPELETLVGLKVEAVRVFEALFPEESVGPVSVAVVYLTAEERRLGDDRKHVSA